MPYFYNTIQYHAKPCSIFLSRKKMKSIKDETDQLYGIIQRFENATKEADQAAKEVTIFYFFFILLKNTI